MKTAKDAAPRKAALKSQRKSQGTIWAEQTRSQCNKLTDAEREKLLDRAMQIAYAADNRRVGSRRG